MAYFDGFNKDNWASYAESYNYFNPYSVTEREIEIARLVSKELLDGYSPRTFDTKLFLTLPELVQKTIFNFCDIGLYRVAPDVASVLQRLEFRNNGAPNDCDFTVRSALVRTGTRICKKCVYVDVPDIYTTSSIAFMSHEIGHIFKESNPLECRGVYTDTEVITMLIELITAYDNNDDNVFKLRESILLSTAETFINLDKEKDGIEQNYKAAFYACYWQSVSYLYSFYYSMKLFKIYLNDKDFVVQLIEDVMLHSITTRELIKRYVEPYFINDDFDYREFGKHLK